MTHPNQQPPELSAEQKAATDAGIKYALQLMRDLPKANNLELEAHMTGVLIVFWGALWGTFGTQYATDFIQAQLHSMETAERPQTFLPPKLH
jgi:hypothetical protein